MPPYIRPTVNELVKYRTIVAVNRASGAGIKPLCDEHGVSHSRFRTWVCREGIEILTPAAFKQQVGAVR